jgi:WD40 repeat protein
MLSLLHGKVRPSLLCCFGWLVVESASVHAQVTPARSLARHTDSVTCLAYAPDGKTIVSGSKDKTIRLWDVGTGKVQFTLQGHDQRGNPIGVETIKVSVQCSRTSFGAV